MKKLFLIIIVSVLAFTLCGCTASEPVAGEELILAARESYQALNSARVDVVNDETGESEQIFIYKYDEKGYMTYCVVLRSQGEEILQYNNGYEQFTQENGVLTVASKGESGFAAYSKDVPYPYATKGLIVFHKKAVAEGSYIAQNELVTEVVHVYDVSKLSQTDGSVTAFTVKYYFDANGELLYFKEISEIKGSDGKISTHSYTIYITEQNAVTTVPNPTKPDVEIGEII